MRLRFVPDMFMHEHTAPVVEVTIEDPEQPRQALELVARFRADFIVELHVTDQELHLTGEMDSEATVLKGSCVHLRHASYSNDELVAIATSFQRTLQKETSQAHLQSTKLEDIKHFVADLIDRAEKKRSMSGRDTGSIEAQLSVLNRVLHRINRARQFIQAEPASRPVLFQVSSGMPGSPRELTKDEYEATFSPPMLDVTETAEENIPLWDYLDPVIEELYHSCSAWDWRVMFIYESRDGRIQHLNVPVPKDNTYLSVVVDKPSARIIGHYLLDLGSMYPDWKGEAQNGT